MNPFGNYLMAEIIKAHFVYNPVFEPDPDNRVCRYVYLPGQPEDQIDGMNLIFEGNRLDLIYFADFENIKNNIFIDDILIRDYRGIFIPSRAYINRHASYPEKIGIPVKIDLRGRPVADHWQMVIKKVEADGYKVHFDLFSNRSGYQGSGDNLTSFCSTNGIVCLMTENWFYRKEPGYFSPWEPVQTGDTLKFEVKELNYIEKNIEKSEQRLIIKGLPEGEHQFRIELNNSFTPDSDLILIIYNPALFNSDL
jgi:hypothetical protein